MKQLSVSSFANFSEYDLIKTLFLISEKPLGRNHLIRKLGLSEASTRSLMKKLFKEKFVRTTTRGISITNFGSSFVNKITAALSGPVQINFGAFSFAFRVKNCAEFVKVGLEQRDAAIKAGASGCLIFVFKNNRLLLPGCEGIENAYMNVISGIQENFKLSDGDAVIVAFADTKRQAELGAWNAAKTLLTAKIYKSG